MKKLFLCVSLFIVASLSAQVGGKDFTYKPMKWTIKVPAGFEKGEADEDLLEEGEEIIFTVAKSESETMEVTVADYNEEEDGDYGTMQEMSATFVEGILKSAIEDEGGELEVTTEKETIGGKTFYHHTYTMVFDGETTIMHLFNGLIVGKDFCMDISYADTAEGEIMLKAFRDSKFK